MKCIDTTYSVDLIRRPNTIRELTKKPDSEGVHATTALNIYRGLARKPQSFRAGMSCGEFNIVSGKPHMLQRWDERERQVYIYNITIYYRDPGPGRPKAPAEVEASTGRDTSKPHR